MFIKRLELLGFKTFADKTELELSEGITAVVGPNGSGKSNIADALMWVLGESNVRNLRGQRATDVIFNGSEKRKALGLAEVSLTLDNTCGTLPLDFSEVTVTRRAYRSGEGEYFINKTRCRLKDIYELFLDTGIGREAYSFVSQGEIDAVLSAKPEDRRELFEEAAGIKKYRYRREEALRKLDRTEANLRRVCDIMAEIGGQLEPLAEQAETAKRFNELQARLWDIEIGLLIRDLRRHTQALAEVRETRAGSAAKLEEYDRRIAELEARKDEQATVLGKLEEEVDEARQVEQTLSANLQRLESKAALLDERLNSAQSARDQVDGEIIALERKIEETRERIGRLEVEEKSCAEADEEVRSAVDLKAAALQELDRLFEQASRTANDQKASYLELARELAAKRTALQNSRDRVAELEVALAKLEREAADLESQRREAAAQREAAEAEAKLLEEQGRKIGDEIAAIGVERTRTRKDESELRSKQAELARDIASRSSRLATLREMAEAHEGFYEGVRGVMAAHKAGRLAGSFAVVADVITVPKGFETAIETALGASVQDVVADSVDSAKRAIEFLKANRAGRATFLPLDGMRPASGEVRGKLDRREGALGIAADLVSYDRKYDPAIRSLLGRTVVAENIDDAVALSRRISGWNKIVTLDGELIMPSGAMTGGTMKSRGPGLLLRKQEIDTLTQEIKGLEKGASEVQESLRKLEERSADLAAKSEDAERSLSELRVSLAEQRRRSDFSGKEIERIARQIETVGLETTEAGRLLEQESASVTRLQEELRMAGQENTDLDRKVATVEQDMEELQKRRSAEREELMRLNAELAGRVERTAALRNSLDESRKALEELTEAMASRHSQSSGISVDLVALATERETIERECGTQRQLAEAAAKRLNDLLSHRAEEAKKAAEIDARLRETSNLRNQLSAQAHEAEVREARLEVQVNQATERLLSEYELTYEQAMEWPEEEIEVERGAATEVARLRREIKEMGPVNTGAIQEYERIRERWDFLTEQRTDLESARTQINTAIAEIDANTRGLFMGTFNSVARNFDSMFVRLFGGGTTRVTLTDPNDLLQTGVDIAVQPPGKKMQDMALLSGGERALTAAALIFALLMVKPSPFVVMDEVDAPLDEANVERFAEVLKEFAANSQFIVVTHNRATMEASDSLYGVTMQEPGISKLISVKLTAEGPVEREVEAALTA
jgi:chromosome segregation protein